MDALPFELIENIIRFLSSKQTRNLCVTSKEMNVRLQDIMERKRKEFLSRKYGERFMKACVVRWVNRYYPNMTVCCEYLMSVKSLPFPTYAKHYICKDWYKMNTTEPGPAWMGQVYRHYNAMQCHVCNASAYTTSIAYGGTNEESPICWDCAH